MKKTIAVLCALAAAAALFFPAAAAGAETRRALVVGINTYRPKSVKIPPARGWQNLSGCVNDANAMRQILRTRFGFEDRNITRLLDGKATRAAILSALKKAGTDSGKGDTVIFYYAGHGSQVPNSKTKEEDRLDETIVPADSALGAKDIRDKELARLYDAILDRGVNLIIIMDSCHSGSGSRAALSPRNRRPRYIKPDTGDAADAYAPAVDAEKRGALVIAAAQDYQLAGEADDATGAGISHGAFTAALIDAISSAPARQPASELFLRVRGIMQSEGEDQDPVMSGTSERKRKPLFGDGAPGTDDVLVAVTEVSGRTITLEGGRALGLNVNSELAFKKLNEDDPDITIRITAVKGLNTSDAEITSGKPEAVKKGSLFTVTKWSVPAGSLLNVWVPQSLFTSGELKDLASRFYRARGAVAWVDDPKTTDPTHVLYWSGDGWVLSFSDGTVKQMGKSADPGKVMKIVRQKTGASFFLSLPPSRDLAADIAAAIKAGKRAVQVSKSPAVSNYHLIGRYRNGSVEYAWVLPDVSAVRLKVIYSLPLSTDWVADSGSLQGVSGAAAILCDYANRLSCVIGWQKLDNPQGGESFPYRLAMKNIATGEMLYADKLKDSTFKDGAQFIPALVLDGGSGQAAGIQSRYVYVFIIDTKGKSSLLYPTSGKGMGENRFPNEGTSPGEIPLTGGEFTIREPYGADTYILLTSDKSIPNPEMVFEFEGVQRGETRKPKSQLEMLIRNYGTGSRGGGDVATEKNWSIQRITVRSEK
jgi:hypothetical protein